MFLSMRHVTYVVHVKWVHELINTYVLGGSICIHDSITVSCRMKAS